MKTSPSFNGKGGNTTQETEYTDSTGWSCQNQGSDGENTGLSSVNLRSGHLVGRA